MTWAMNASVLDAWSTSNVLAASIWPFFCRWAARHCCRRFTAKAGSLAGRCRQGGVTSCYFLMVMAQTSHPRSSQQCQGNTCQVCQALVCCNYGTLTDILLWNHRIRNILKKLQGLAHAEKSGTFCIFLLHLFPSTTMVWRMPSGMSAN